jgi:hypothetical protein
VAAAAGTAAVLVLTAAPAAAHTITGVQPTDYKSEVLSVSPDRPGFGLRLLDLGRRVRLTNTTTTDAVVLGYQGEPYLRVGPAGVYQNDHSPTLYLNRSSNPPSAGEQAGLPPQADAKAAPQWDKVSGGHTATWHDRRTRWEGPEPPAVRAAPGEQHLVAQWSIPMRYGDTPAVANGRITWVPGPSAVPWLIVALVAFLATAAIAWTRWWGPLLAAAVAVLVAVDAVHSFATTAAAANAVIVTIGKVLGLGFLSALAWLGGIWSIGRLQRRNEVGLLIAALSGFVIALYGVSDTGSLGRSQVPYAFPPVTARFAVALSLGMGFGLVAAVVAVFKRTPGLVTRASSD